MITKLYRYEYNSENEDMLKDVKLVLYEFEIIRFTPKGCFIKVYNKEKFVLSTAKNKYAYPSHAGAKNGFKRRKENEIAILNSRLKVARAYLSLFY